MTEAFNSSDETRQINVQRRGWFRRFMAFVGPAYLVSVGYMDPGNWATDIEGGSRFGYALLWVLLLSNLMAMLLQTLAARLGIVTGLDLAQACRREYSRFIGVSLWVLTEIAIAATDLAEVLGTVIGLNLLFGLPLIWGCLVTAGDTFLLLVLQRFGVRRMEAFIVMLVGTIGFCFLIEVFLARPDWGGIAAGFVPRLPPGALYVAIGIIGATVMPHNLYLHSSLVQSRRVARTLTGRREACRYNLWDSIVALNGAFFVNAAILVVAAATFHSRGLEVTEIQTASRMLQSTLGSSLAPLAFGIALLAAGQSSTLTGTISGQVVMEGFLNIRTRPWLRRLLTRTVALGPAVVVILWAGNSGVYQLLVLSQVILSLQLPFAVIPLLHFTSDRSKMGDFANPVWVRVLGWLAAGLVVALNACLLGRFVLDRMAGAPSWGWGVVALALLPPAALLLAVALHPVFRPGPAWADGVQVKGRLVRGGIVPLRLRHIGAALEHAPGDAVILSAALSLAQSHGARLTLLHVVDTPGAQMLGAESASFHQSEDQTYLDELVREIETPLLPVESLLKHGVPGEEIVKAVEEAGFDLLVLGSHGHRGLQDLIFGETVTSVRHAVTIPVFIVRTPGGAEAQQPSS